MFQLIANTLAWIYSVVPNYALSIAILTLIIMVLLTPLTLKSTKSMLEMQRIQPELRRLQQQYKGDRQKLNEEMMKLYQEHKINPLGGCLPLLLQAPVFIILYRVLAGLTKRGPDGTFDPSYITESSQLYQALDGQTQMMSFGMDLSESAANAIADSFVHGIPYLLLVLAVMGTSYYQQRQISARNSTSQVNRQQQLIMRLMPLFFGVISLTLPSGLVVYFLVSNLYRIATQAYITRKYYRGDAVLARTGEDVKDVKEVKMVKERPAPARPTPNRPAPTKTSGGRVTPSKGTSKGGGAKGTPPATTGRGTPSPPAKGPSSGSGTPRQHPRPTSKKKK